jgi:TusA-related sulfurtransferase
MSEITLDCRGLSCPLPVLEVKKQLDQGQQTFSIRVDAPVAVENISRFLANRGHKFTLTQEDLETVITVTA